MYLTLVRKALDLAGEELRGRRVIGEIMIHGRTAVVLRYSWSDDGNRIEAEIGLEGRHGIVRQAVVGAGRSVGLPNDWVEDVLPAAFGHGLSASAGFPTGMYPSWERPGLRVLSAPASLLVSMTFLASLRSMDDIGYDDLEPAIRIAAQAGIKSARRLKGLVAPYLERREKSDGDLARTIGRRLSQFEYALDRFGCRVVLRSKPKSLADVAAMAREDSDCFRLASGEFLQAFYLEKDKAVQQAMLDPVPIPTGDSKDDAWLGAIGEHLAQRWDLEVPPWTQEVTFIGGQTLSFWPDEALARDIQIVETPPAFRRRLLFTYAEPLMNAKFPNNRKVRMPFWQ
ncbi:hypothetical protein JKG68_28045 [Microvirga aerilata]|uniref:Uncharacterized protein n=1 Tax=Microvirga aerilata TaxID=670292 RepID=A0A937D3E9_9HYPH|nr:hypothetical protein [Microvirga aerilata]MBL0407762.1 hypothetical protein [Microvirga aerilata]